MESQEVEQSIKTEPGDIVEVSGKAAQGDRSTLHYWGLRSWHLWIGLIFSSGFLWLTLRNIDLHTTVETLRRVNMLILGVAVANYVISIVAKAARWRLLLAVHKSPSFRRAFSIFSVGQMMNSFFPAHLGEFVRAYLMGEAEADSKIYVLGTIAVERMADLLFLLISLVLLLSQMILPDWLASSARSAALVIMILVPLFVLLVWQRNSFMRIVEKASHLVPSTWREWLVRQMRYGLSSLDSVRNPRLLVGIIGWSLIICTLSALTNYLVFLALGLTLPLWASLLLLVVLQVGTEVPSSPGGIGVFQYLIILTLSFFAIDKNVALGYSVLLYLVIYVPIAAIGVYCLWHEKITWKKLDEAVSLLKRLKSKAI